MQTTYVETPTIIPHLGGTIALPVAIPEGEVCESTKPFEGQKIILLDGPVIRCLGPGCNIDTNARYLHKGDWVPACMRSHIASRSPRVKRKAA